jgi:hypothetical protein
MGARINMICTTMSNLAILAINMICTTMSNLAIAISSAPLVHSLLPKPQRISTMHMYGVKKLHSSQLQMIMLLSHYSFHNMRSPARVMGLFTKILRVPVMELSVNNAGILKVLAGLTMLELGLGALFMMSVWIIIIRRFLMSMINHSTKQEKPKERCRVCPQLNQEGDNWATNKRKLLHVGVNPADMTWKRAETNIIIKMINGT